MSPSGSDSPASTLRRAPPAPPSGTHPHHTSAPPDAADPPAAPDTLESPPVALSNTPTPLPAALHSARPAAITQSPRTVPATAPKDWSALLDTPHTKSATRD